MLPQSLQLEQATLAGEAAQAQYDKLMKGATPDQIAGALGRFFTVDVATYTDQRVVDAPPYRRIRHPSYSGSMLSLVGTGLMLGHWLGLLLIALASIVTFGYRVRLEERALLAALGEPYAAYMRRTKRFVPFLF